jgi:hypothetical protein
MAFWLERLSGCRSGYKCKLVEYAKKCIEIAALAVVYRKKLLLETFVTL